LIGKPTIRSGKLSNVEPKGSIPLGSFEFFIFKEQNFFCSIKKENLKLFEFQMFRPCRIGPPGSTLPNLSDQTIVFFTNRHGVATFLHPSRETGYKNIRKLIDLENSYNAYLIFWTFIPCFAFILANPVAVFYLTIELCVIISFPVTTTKQKREF
jgi:hypothetical protein